MKDGDEFWKKYWKIWGEYRAAMFESEKSERLRKKGILAQALADVLSSGKH